MKSPARGPLRAFIAAGAMVLFIAQAPPPASNSDLDRIRGEIARLKQRLDEVHQQTRNVQQELEAADLELGIHTRELQIAQETWQRVDRQRVQTEAQIAELIERIARQKQHLGRRLVALYRLGGLSYLRILM
ncbi:MAG: hypothetical protein ACXW2Q_12755, partial [Thermoanaerobaculia bacterium]